MGKDYRRKRHGVSDARKRIREAIERELERSAPNLTGYKEPRYGYPDINSDSTEEMLDELALKAVEGEEDWGQTKSVSELSSPEGLEEEDPEDEFLLEMEGYPESGD